MNCLRVAISTLFILTSCALSYGQGASAPCPIALTSIDPAVVSIHVTNTGGKNIVGLVFHVALADAAEHWKWLHWDFDDTRPLREFGWNKMIKAGATKRLAWRSANLDFEHGGGGAFVLTSALFEDGTNWEDSNDTAACKLVWHHDHKKRFTKPVVLPPRDR